jgi:site-specific recombinase XerD
MTTRGVSQCLKAIGDKVGIPKEKMHPHAFRHFFAKMYLRKTKDVVGLADLLGHGSVDTTRIYLQKSKEEQRQSFNRTITW